MSRKVRLAFPLIQIAGVKDRAEAELVRECGVCYLGFPLGLPVHAQDLGADDAKAIIECLEPPCVGVLITYLNRAAAIARLCRRLGARIVQLHGEVSLPELESLRRLVPDLTVVKSLVVGLHPGDALERLGCSMEPWVDAFITDTYDPATGACGATGRVHDWGISRRLAKSLKRPLILAGGLTPDNVAEAIRAVGPAGVDAHSGVEDAHGCKDPEKLLRFVAAARAAFAERVRIKHRSWQCR